ncbi:MAG: DUF354 domain-containing protein [bacterium]|nr:DUF354 domain-containing protein [bacterium]
MNILIDLQHPAHLHFFRPMISRLQKEGHTLRITGRDKDILVELAEKYNIPVNVFGKAKKGAFHLGKELLYRWWKLFKIIGRFKPDALLAIAGTFIALPGRLRGVPVYIFYDTEHATISNLLAYPLSNCIFVPRCYRKAIRWKHVRYNGFHELAYLHPDYFKADDSVLKEVGIKPGESFSLVRLVGWGAGHDIGLSGLTDGNKMKAVNELEAYGKVFISCEGDLPRELERYRLKLDVTKVHSLMAHASLIFGESATMASEGAMLGVPGVYIDPVGRGYTDELEKEYAIVFNFTHRQQEDAIKKAVTLLADGQKDKCRQIGERIVAEKIDVSEMLYQIALHKHFPADAGTFQQGVSK